MKLFLFVCAEEEQNIQRKVRKEGGGRKAKSFSTSRNLDAEYFLPSGYGCASECVSARVPMRLRVHPRGWDTSVCVGVYVSTRAGARVGACAVYCYV